MKRTTKIVLGIIAAIFVLSILFIIYAAITFDSENYNRYSYKYIDETAYTIPQKNMNVSKLAPFKIVSLDIAPNSDNEPISIVGVLTIQSQNTKETDSNEITMADSLRPYISTKIVNDTLKIEVDRTAIYKAYKNKIKDRYTRINGIDITLDATNPDIKIVNKIGDVTVMVNNLNANNISISTVRGETRVNSSQIKHLNAESTIGYLAVDKSRIDTLSIDLDNLNGWDVTDCKIDVENITGGRYHNIRQSKTESNTVNWKPKNKNAELNITIPNDTVRIIFP